ncbi:hypothetical protein [Photobacterium galatheae]|uniref:hypothetical protein n=1 Tax=Photobacterium galatheae TaxID=1654360 RepID=UPI00202D0CB6|nr:hypothetical protein [Photobacterium galatheae]
MKTGTKQARGYHLISRVVLPGLMLVLSGCASRESVKLVSEYAKQSAQVQEALLGVYERTEQARVDSVLAGAVRDGATGKALDVQRIDNSGQIQALKHLLVFTQSINALASDDVNADLNEQAEKLNAALVSLSEYPQVQGVSQKQVELASISANALARAYTESARYEALKRLMKTSQPVIQNTIDELRSDLPFWKRATRTSLQKELRIRLYLLNNPNRCEQRDDDRCVVFSHSLEERMEAYRKAYRIKQEIVRLDAEFMQLDKALQSIQTTNTAIVESLESDNDLSLSAAKKAIKSTKVQVNAIKAFQKSLKEES